MKTKQNFEKIFSDSSRRLKPAVDICLSRPKAFSATFFRESTPKNCRKERSKKNFEPRFLSLIVFEWIPSGHYGNFSINHPRTAIHSHGRTTTDFTCYLFSRYHNTTDYHFMWTKRYFFALHHAILRSTMSFTPFHCIPQIDSLISNITIS